MKNEKVTITPRQWLVFWLIVLMTVVHAMTGKAQEVKRDSLGIYVAAAGRTIAGIDTGKKFRAPDGSILPIYVSANGKHYVVLVSKKTGKSYKQYLTLN